jgi:PmbA protein
MLPAHIQTLLEKVSAAGATGDLIVDSGESVSFKANAGELEEHTVRSSQILGLRVIKDAKVGMAYSEATDENAVEELVAQALTNASFGATNDYETISLNGTSLVTDDELLAPEDTTSVEQKIDFALKLETDLAAKDKVQNVPYNGVTDSLSVREVYSTSGLQAVSRSRSAVAYAYALAVDGEHNAMAGTGRVQRRFAELNTEDIVQGTWQECLALLEGKPVATKHYDVIFDADQQSSLFDAFSLAFSGKSAKDGVNPWREQIGKVVADERLQLNDNPTRTDGFGYELFDVEGELCSDLPVIENGTLNSLLHNRTTAQFFKTKSTGHASRGPKSALSVSAHQWVIAAGDANEGSLKEDEYLYITDLTGLHSGANAISGNFSFGASGYLCKNGERVQSVRGITIAGNFYDMLKNIRCIGDTQEWNWQKSSLMAPIRFSELAISGN